MVEPLNGKENSSQKMTQMDAELPRSELRNQRLEESRGLGSDKVAAPPRSKSPGFWRYFWGILRNLEPRKWLISRVIPPNSGKFHSKKNFHGWMGTPGTDHDEKNIPGSNTAEPDGWTCLILV
jgi:hypothetical protein